MNNETTCAQSGNFFFEMPFNRSFAASVFIHGAVIAAIFMVIHCIHRQKPLRLPQTITLISFPLPEKKNELPRPAPQRVQVGSVKKTVSAPTMQQPSEPALPHAATVAPEANPVPSTDATRDLSPSVPSTGGTPGPGTGEIGVPVRIGSTGALDNVEFSPLYNPKPAYPPIALRAGIQGSVDVDLVINEFGRVEEFFIVNVVGHPLFGEETAKVIGKWRFPPPRVDGKKVRIKFLYTVNFKLD